MRQRNGFPQAAPEEQAETAEAGCTTAKRLVSCDTKMFSGATDHFGVAPAHNEWRENASSAEPMASAKELRNLLETQGYKCALCDGTLSPNNSDVDHIIPISAGGDDRVTNLQWLCRRCNRAKGNMSSREFILLCCKIVTRHAKVSETAT